MKLAKIRHAAALVLNLLTFLLVLGSILWFFRPADAGEGLGNMSTHGSGCFIFFTNDSNIFAALTALICLPFNLRSIRSGRDAMPKAVLTLKLVSTTAVALTMTVVLLFLGPTQGYGPMFAGVCLPLHLLCPLMALVTFCFLERGLTVSKTRLLLTVIPTLLYGTVYLLCVVVFGVWGDFYGFNRGGYWYISYTVLPAATYLLALIVRAIHNACEKNSRQEL